MNRSAVAAVGVAAALLAGGGSALAAELQSGPSGGDGSRCEERLARIAERRGVSVAELEAQVQARLLARVDAALAAGRISAEQAAKLRERIATGSLCPRPAHARIALRRALAAAAHYLGLTKEELRRQLPGTSLAALAEKQGKSVDGLKAAILAPAKARLAKAVENGRIARERADRVLERLEHLVDRLVEKTFPAR